jgi:hypothetical protein
LLVLAHLRCGNTYSRLAAGFGVGVATVHRYVAELVDLLAVAVCRCLLEPIGCHPARLSCGPFHDRPTHIALAHAAVWESGGYG